MGFEFKIITTVSEEKKKEILDFISARGYTTNRAEDGWPDIFLEVEKDGITICKNRTSDLWYGIEDFKIYLEENEFQYSVEEL